MHHYNITVISHAQIWYALNTHHKNQTLSNKTVEQKAKITYRENGKKEQKIRNICISEMKTTIYYTVTFLAYLLANSSMAKFISSVNCCSVESVARFLKRKVLILDLKQFLIRFIFEKLLSQPATLTPIVRKICSIITIFGTEFPRLYFWINCRNSTGPSFSTVNCTSATSYNCDATITFFLIAQQWTTSDATPINISFSVVCSQPPVQLTGLLRIWMQYGDLKIFIMTHQHTEARNNFP